jgi:hypothetical protein
MISIILRLINPHIEVHLEDHRHHDDHDRRRRRLSNDATDATTVLNVADDGGGGEGLQSLPFVSWFSHTIHPSVGHLPSTLSVFISSVFFCSLSFSLSHPHLFIFCFIVNIFFLKRSASSGYGAAPAVRDGAAPALELLPPKRVHHLPPLNTRTLYPYPFSSSFSHPQTSVQPSRRFSS